MRFGVYIGPMYPGDMDGTKAFVRGYPIFSVQIALMHKQELVLGVSCAPCWNGGAGETIWAERGKGALQLPADLSVLAEKKNLHAGRWP